MSRTETVAVGRWVPDAYREWTFLVAALFGVLAFSIGMIGLILGLSLGYRQGGFLTPALRLVISLAGVTIIVDHLTTRIKAFEGLPVEGDLQSRLAGNLVLVPTLVGVLVASAGIIVGLPDGLGLPATAAGSPMTFVTGFGLGTAVAFVLGGVLFGLKVVGSRLAADALPRRRDALTATALVFGHRWTRNPSREGVLDDVRRSGRIWLLYVGMIALFLGVSAETTVSAPFLTTPSDKYLLVGGGALLMWAGVDIVRLAGRVVGW